MPVTTVGLQDDNVILSNQRKIDMYDEIALLEPDETPLITILQKLPKKAAMSQKVEWLEDELLPRLTTLGANVLIGDTTVTFATGTGTYFRAGDVLRIPATGENVEVTSFASADVANVTRGIGSQAAIAATSGYDIVRVSNAAAEGATLGVLKSTKKVAQYNYCQIVRVPFGVTETLANSSLWGGSEPENEEKKKLIEHKRDLESMIVLGRRLLNTGGSTPKAYCGGLTDYISTNKTNVGGALTASAFDDILRGAFRYGSRQKVLFCAPVVLKALAGFPLGRLAPPSNEQVNSWGVTLKKYISSQGDEVLIAPKRDWQDMQLTNNQMGGWGLIVDVSNVQLRPLRDTRVLPNRQANDEDSRKHEYLTEQSLVVKHERTHAHFYGVTG